MRANSNGFALIAVVLMIVGVLAIISMVSTQRLILLSKMCNEERVFLQANYLAESAKADALYYLYDNQGISGGDSYNQDLKDLYDTDGKRVGKYKYSIENYHTADWTYRIYTWGLHYPPNEDFCSAKVAAAVYANDADGDFRFTPITEFIRYRR